MLTQAQRDNLVRIYKQKARGEADTRASLYARIDQIDFILRLHRVNRIRLDTSELFILHRVQPIIHLIIKNSGSLGYISSNYFQQRLIREAIRIIKELSHEHYIPAHYT